MKIHPIVSLIAVGLIVLEELARFRPEYKPLCTALGMIFLGVMLIYYTLTLPAGMIANFNQEIKSFRRIPLGGPKVRKYLLVFGVITLTVGVIDLGVFLL